MQLFTPTKATMIATLTATFLAIIKFGVGISSGSIVVLASAIDSLLDICISAFNYFALKEAKKPANKHFNYGFIKIPYIATMLEGMFILASAGYIFYESIRRLDAKIPLNETGSAIGVMVFSTIVVGILVLFLKKVAKMSGNEVIQADILHYQSDLFSNGAILISLVVIQTSGFYLIDPILGMLIAIYIAYGAFKIIKSGIFMLLDRALDEKTQQAIEAIFDTSAILGYDNLKTRIVGDRVFLVVYVVFEEGITLLSAHSISDEIEKRIEAIDPSKQWEIIIHLEPAEYFENSHLDFTKRKSS
ncbi:cation diffusion facilitator family transporter [Helicobacter sp. 11S02596-1]|uniref:cation diffusion facilitator family transporter n=1 Tax=Helicobacter sp. 11S02596-1 TaxID=1476194 RepID=UPI000BA72D92|nr:cation diffusion facilitator family transporter [Helicobacter sp. 11S02596-1]PAF42339.1 hypothetical protein BJI48_06895 [Helicobacter sp. 11S02596-1]